MPEHIMKGTICCIIQEVAQRAADAYHAVGTGPSAISPVCKMLSC